MIHSSAVANIVKLFFQWPSRHIDREEAELKLQEQLSWSTFPWCQKTPLAFDWSLIAFPSRKEDHVTLSASSQKATRSHEEKWRRRQQVSFFRAPQLISLLEDLLCWGPVKIHTVIKFHNSSTQTQPPTLCKPTSFKKWLCMYVM